MGLETGTYIDSLVSTNPVAGDDVGVGDDHLRLIKSTIKATFPNISGAVTPTHTELNYVDGVTSAIQTQLDAKVSTTSALLKGSWRLIATKAASSSSSVDFVNGVDGAIDSTYDEYMVELLAVKPSNASASFYLRTSTNAGSSFDAGASDYQYNFIESVSSTVTGANAAGIAIFLAQNAYNAGHVFGEIKFWLPAVAAKFHAQHTLMVSTGSYSLTAVGGGYRDTAADVDGIRFIMSAGQITSGTFNLYGRVK